MHQARPFSPHSEICISILPASKSRKSRLNPNLPDSKTQSLPITPQLQTKREFREIHWEKHLRQLKTTKSLNFSQQPTLNSFWLAPFSAYLPWNRNIILIDNIPGSAAQQCTKTALGEDCSTTEVFWCLPAGMHNRWKKKDPVNGPTGSEWDWSRHQPGYALWGHCHPLPAWPQQLPDGRALWFSHGNPGKTRSMVGLLVTGIWGSMLSIAAGAKASSKVSWTICPCILPTSQHFLWKFRPNFFTESGPFLQVIKQFTF